MLVVTTNWRLWMAGMAVSLAIFGVVFFTVIKPSSDSANQALKSGLQQSQQVINQAQKQLGTAAARPAQRPVRRVRRPVRRVRLPPRRRRS